MTPCISRYCKNEAYNCKRCKICLAQNYTHESVCAVAGCGVVPTLGLPSSPSTHCATHATSAMIRTRLSDKCSVYHCTKRASHGLRGQSASRCSMHAESTMVNVITRKCCVCNVSASFNYPKLYPAYCLSHSRAGMVNIFKKRCIARNCELSRTFCIAGGPALYCAQHAPHGYIHKKRFYRALVARVDTRTPVESKPIEILIRRI